MASSVTTTATRLHTAALSNVRREGSAMGWRAIPLHNQKQSAARFPRANLEVACVAGGAKMNKTAAEKGTKYGARLIGAFRPVVFIVRFFRVIFPK
eukprot:4286649-Pyramimonas_sp.AAC.1